jgi:uncharacterized protein
VLAFALWLSLAATPLTPPSPTHWVNDPEGLVSPSTRDGLDARLANFERTSGHQVVLWLGSSTNGEPIDSFAERAFKAWKVGRAGLDDGVVLFVFMKDRTVRIEVGYGLEAALPDLVCARIIREQLAPKLAAGDLDGALTAGVDALTGAVAPSSGAPPVAMKTQLTKGGWIGLGVGLLALVILFIVRPGLMLQLLSLALIFRRGGSGGGGFSGGGGRSGGGGSSGRF